MTHVRRGSVLKLATALSLLGACEFPFEPQGAYRIEPPPEYRVAWTKVEICSGLRGSFARVRWHAVPQSPFPCPGGRVCRGVWVPAHNIYIAQGFLRDIGDDLFTVRHEILHDLLQRDGHPPVFVTCGLLRSAMSDTLAPPPDTARLYPSPH